MKKTIKILALFLIISCKAQTTVNLNTYNIGDNSPAPERILSRGDTNKIKPLFRS
jgi:hypothetical protein